MAERSRIIEGKWVCSSCGTKEILARFKSCPSCNNPREVGAESQFDFGARTASGGLAADAVTDAKALEEAASGPDWACEYCSTKNRGSMPRCRHCGAERSAGAIEDALPPPPPPPPAALAAEVPPPPKKKSHRGRYLFGGVVLALIAVCSWATRTHEVVARRADARWERLVHLEQFVPVQKEGWRDELTVRRAVMPVNGRGETAGVENVRACHRMQRGTRKVADGTERVCHTRSRSKQCGTEESCSTQDLGNGFTKEVCHDVPRYCDEDYEECANETRYREEPVYADKCTYDTYEWRRTTTQRSSGAGLNAIAWPEVPVPQTGRLVREEKYEVVFAYEDGGKRDTYTKELLNEEEYRRWAQAKEAVLKISNLGSVDAAEPR